MQRSTLRLGHDAASEAIGMRKGDLSGQVMAETIRRAIRNADLLPEDIDHTTTRTEVPCLISISAIRRLSTSCLGDHAYRIPI